MDLGVAGQAHHVAPAVPALEPAEQCLTREGAIGQQRDRPEPGQEPIGLLQQADRHRCTDAGTGMLQGLPEQRNRPSVADH